MSETENILTAKVWNLARIMHQGGFEGWRV
jgi:hypothetical protein